MPKEIVAVATSTKILSTYLSENVPTTNAIMVVEKSIHAKGKSCPQHKSLLYALKIRPIGFVKRLPWNISQN